MIFAIITMTFTLSRGCMAPEYLHRGEISTWSDIYSLGILIIEITTGQKNSMNDKAMSARSFIDQARLYIYY
jgi:disease resistance protein RPM1